VAEGHGRAQYVTVTDQEALAAFRTLTRMEGIIPALESSHALAYVAKLAPQRPRDSIMVVNLSGAVTRTFRRLRASTASRCDNTVRATRFHLPRITRNRGIP